MDLQRKNHIFAHIQAFCNICGESLCQSMSCAWQRTFRKIAEKRRWAHGRLRLLGFAIRRNESSIPPHELKTDWIFSEQLH